MRVVLAEESSATRSAWRSLVESVGISPKDVVEAEDAAALLTLVGSGEVSLVVLSWSLSGLSGSALLGAIRQERKGAETPVLAVGDPADVPGLEASTMFGLTGYVTRPVDPAVLAGKMRLALFGEQAVARAEDAGREAIRTIVSAAAAEAELPFFMQLPSSAMDEFLKLSIRKKFPAGTTIIAAGQPVEALHVLTTGQAELREGDSPPRILDMGDCFGEVAFLTEKQNTVTVTASGPVEVNSLSRPGLAELVRHHPALTPFLSALISRRTQLRPGRPPQAPPSGVGGSLSSMPFPDLIQMLHSTRKTGVVALEDGEKKAGIVVEDGEVRHAWADALTGEAAFHRIAGWKRGSFYFRAEPAKTQTATIRAGSTIGLLMEAMRRADEASGRPA